MSDQTGCILVRNGRVIIDKGGGQFVVVPHDPEAHYVCPYCGSTKAYLEQRLYEYHEWIRCAQCHEVIGWSTRLIVPCPTCGKVWKKWSARDDGKVEATCMCCGRFEAYPD